MLYNITYRDPNDYTDPVDRATARRFYDGTDGRMIWEFVDALTDHGDMIRSYIFDVFGLEHMFKDMDLAYAVARMNVVHQTVLDGINRSGEKSLPI